MLTTSNITTFRPPATSTQVQETTKIQTDVVSEDPPEGSPENTALSQATISLLLMSMTPFFHMDVNFCRKCIPYDHPTFSVPTSKVL